MPVCIQQPQPDGTFELSTVHQPASDMSFYADINNLRQVGRLRAWLGRKVLNLNTVAAVPHEDVEPLVTQQAADIVASAKKVTGLSVKDLTSVFRVSRQTIYNYRKSQEAIADRNWVRLKSVDHEISKLSEILPYSPGSLAKHFQFEGNTLFELLSAEKLDSQKIERLANELAGQLSASRQRANVHHQTSIDQLTRHA